MGCVCARVCMRACVRVCVSDSATLWTVAHQAPQSMGFSRQEYWGQLPFPSPGNLPNPAIEPTSPALTGGFFTTQPPGYPGCYCYCRGSEWMNSVPAVLLGWREHHFLWVSHTSCERACPTVLDLICNIILSTHNFVNTYILSTHMMHSMVAGSVGNKNRNSCECM